MSKGKRRNEHRVVIAMEHDTSRGLIHGCCTRCCLPWPCPAEQKARIQRAQSSGDAEIEPSQAEVERLREALTEVERRTIGPLRSFVRDALKKPS